MATLCLDASLETLRPFCYLGTHRLQGDLCRCFHEDLFRLSRLSWHFWQAISSKTAHNLLSRVLRSGLSEGQSSALIKAGTFLRSHSWVVLVLGRTWVLLEDPFLATEEGHVKLFHNVLEHVLLINWDTIFAPFVQKWRCITIWWDTSYQTMM